MTPRFIFTTRVLSPFTKHFTNKQSLLLLQHKQLLRTFATMVAATDVKNYKLNHSMIRVKDPQRSIKFYNFLGMKVVKKLTFPDSKFDLYFLGYDGPKAVSTGKTIFDREGLIELTHNYGSEHDSSFKVNNGNEEPNRGFGHICISVDNIQAACKRVEEEGYKFKKKLTEGSMNHIAFALDPDGYWVEIIGQKSLEESEKNTKTDVETYRMNHTMIRVKDAQKSLEFYKNVLGMNLVDVKESPKSGFNLHFLGYTHGTESVQKADREGLLELTWNYGTEKEENFKYHDGNSEPKGFGHICVSVDDIEAACKRFDDLKCNWKKRLTDGTMKNIAFLLDPDGYWIEVVQNERISGKENF